MPRRREHTRPGQADGRPTPAADQVQADAWVPPVLHPRQVFDLAAAAKILGLKRSCLPRECRLGRLAYTKRAGKVFVTGQALWDWLQDGRVVRRRQAEPAPSPCSCHGETNGTPTTGGHP